LGISILSFEKTKSVVPHNSRLGWDGVALTWNERSIRQLSQGLRPVKSQRI